MSIFVRYPDDWIGVPACGDGEMFAEPREWASALVDELIEIDTNVTLAASEREALISALTLLGSGVRERGATAAYIHLGSLRGPIEVVDLALVARADVGDAPAHEIAGSLDPDAIAPPTVTNVVTPGGLHGALVIRHAPFDEQAPHIVTLRATAALDVGEGFAVLGTATTDLAGFEAFRPYFLELIDSVVVAS